jgi:hypothetical protein
MSTQVRKYEFTGETEFVAGQHLQQIRALIDIPNRCKAGDIGGWIEKEANLSHEGNCWVYGNACVSKTLVYIGGLTWHVTITDQHMAIGCQQHRFAEWDAFTDEEIVKMDGKNAVRFWRENKQLLMTLCNNHKV